MQISISFSWQPAYWATVVGVGMVLTGFGTILLGWQGIAALLEEPLQLPYAVSGGLAGVSLIGFGAALVNVQATRHLAARERANHRQLLREASHLVTLAQLHRASAKGSSTGGPS